MRSFESMHNDYLDPDIHNKDWSEERNIDDTPPELEPLGDIPEQEIYLIIEGDYIPLSQCEFLDISEDFWGYDCYTVNYKGKTYNSRATLRYTA